MYDTVLFDLDGTLTDPKEGITKGVQYALKYYGIIEEDLDKLLCFIGPPLKEQFMKYCGFDEKRAEDAVLKYRELYSKTGIFQNRVYDGIEEMLKALQLKGIRLGIASSKPQVFVEKIIERFNIDKYFSVVVGSELNGKRSDKSEVIKEAINQFEIEDKNRVVMVGDRSHDIIGAKKNDIKSIGVCFGYGSKKELEESGADYIAKSVVDLTDILNDITCL